MTLIQASTCLRYERALAPKSSPVESALKLGTAMRSDNVAFLVSPSSSCWLASGSLRVQVEDVQ